MLQGLACTVRNSEHCSVHARVSANALMPQYSNKEVILHAWLCSCPCYSAPCLHSCSYDYVFRSHPFVVSHVDDGWVLVAVSNYLTIFRWSQKGEFWKATLWSTIMAGGQPVLDAPNGTLESPQQLQAVRWLAHRLLTYKLTGLTARDLSTSQAKPELKFVIISKYILQSGYWCALAAESDRILCGRTLPKTAS
jgi:hypothetical protein